jgi:hypothetical protein
MVSFLRARGLISRAFYLVRFRREKRFGMRGKEDLITGEFYQMKEIGGGKIILECLSEPNRWWIGEEEEFALFFRASEEMKQR